MSSDHLLRQSAPSAVHQDSAPSVVSRDPETFAIIGAAMEVHSVLGNGFLEAVYQDALEREFVMRGIPYQREQPIPVLYKGCQLSTPYRADFVCYDGIIVELKAIKKLTEIEDAQVLHYLKATDLDRALLFNFATPRLEHKRFVNHYLRESASSAVQIGAHS
ncbi:MAG: GxxExxY protein [Kiritimatiellia bacterium]|jgi:GxxExxY protein